MDASTSADQASQSRSGRSASGPSDWEGSGILPGDAFAFALDGEFRRARRTRTAFTLVVFDTTPQEAGPAASAGEIDLRELSRVVRSSVREVDLLGEIGNGRLTLLLVDADRGDSERVTRRLISRLEACDFMRSRRLSIGSASFPAEAFDARSLTAHALSHALVVAPRA